MRKYVLIVGLVAAVGGYGQAQELEQLKLNLEKLVQLKLLLSQMQQGYQTLQQGYDAVSDAAKGNFQLHRNYLDGLLQVSPALKKHPAYKRIATLQPQLAADLQALPASFGSSRWFSAQERLQLTGSCDAIREAMRADSELLRAVFTPGALRMSDGERAEVVMRVDQSLRKQETTLNTLRAHYGQLLALRMQHARDMEGLRKVY